MGNNSNSDQRNSIDHIDRDTSDEATPLFLRIRPYYIETVAQSLTPIQSLVDFIRKGNKLDDKATKQASLILKRTSEKIHKSDDAEQILFELVPTPNRSCSGLAESFVLLLTQSNEEVVLSALSLLRVILFDVQSEHRFAFVETGFFTFLPPAFYEHEMHIFHPCSLDLTRIVKDCLIDLHPDFSRRLCSNRDLSISAFQQIFVDMFFRPVEPFLDFICKNRRQIQDSWNSYLFSDLLGRIVINSPFLEEMTQFMLSYLFVVTYTDSLHFFEDDISTGGLIQNLTKDAGSWEEDPAVQKRYNQLLLKLSEEGLWDESELNVRCRCYSAKERRVVFIGAQLMQSFGGNTPFFVE
ncbi:hypothetical protein BLNAU_17287 [Blattamonas nauphoetae]|uniref:Uncharacterized protein n=1 Tax=Blattamonas nauphoetae TaxID=2049346 RepID=A0ABQ9X7G0_9EUKA|nr:hypothetical protein BLNAU_17287 [Blattamonas nauphoetae]